MATYKLIGPFKQLLTLEGLAIKGALQDESLAPIEQAGILLTYEADAAQASIHRVGAFEELKKEALALDAEIETLEGDYVAVPAYVDAHTHICFAGSRANDYAMRNSGKSYLEIAKAGGGIWDTVSHTRKASEEELKAGIIKRAKRHLADGITTIEVKSGYGLSIKEELKMLNAIQQANKELPVDLIATCLAAHIFPKDYDGQPADYLKEVQEVLFPLIKSHNLAARVDAFIEEEAFTPQVVAPYFKKAQEMGFDITVHADQFHVGGSQVAIDFNALSADHLEASTEKEIEQLAKSDVIAMALPGASMGIGCAYTPARKILDAGGALAIASDWNPGSGPMGDLVLQACLLGTFQKLSNAEVLAAITYRAAAALNLNDRGRLVQGHKADFLLYETNHYNEIFYQQGKLKPSQVWKDGERLV